MACQRLHPCIQMVDLKVELIQAHVIRERRF